MARCIGCIHTDVCNREVGYGYAECPHYKSADVAPKAEVEYWKEQCFNACMNNGCLDKAIVDAAVARKIFEEIENKIGIGHDVIDIFNILAELKKKYTEEQK